jgi:chromosome segregation protein
MKVKITIAKSQLQQRGDVAEPESFTDRRAAQSSFSCSHLRSRTRLAVRTIEERVDSVAARALALELSAQSERDASERAIIRRSARARAAVISQAVAEAAYEVLIHIERSIAKCCDRTWTSRRVPCCKRW